MVWLVGGGVDEGKGVEGQRALFLVGVSAVFFVAFRNLGHEISALAGPGGVCPVGHMLARPRTRPAAKDASLASKLGWVARAWWARPTLLWVYTQWPQLTSSLSLEGGLEAHASLGQALSVWSVLFWGGVAGGWVVPGGFFLSAMAVGVLGMCCVLYRSLTAAAATLTAFQWDILLVECGVFAAVYAAGAYPSRLVAGYGTGMVAKLMFSSGVVKFSSRCPTWRNLTAMDFHHTTQPLPHLGGYFASRAPHALHAAAVVGNHVVEAVLPPIVFLLSPVFPVLGLVGFSAYLALQIGIVASGNYGFFNWLTAAMCLLLLNDDQIPLFTGTPPSDAQGEGGWVGLGLGMVWMVVKVGLVSVGSLVSLVHVRNAFRDYDPLDLVSPERAGMESLLTVFDVGYGWARSLSRFWVCNGYGLFARMTTDRPEVNLFGSDDGETWTLYEWKYKPGSLDRAPVYTPMFMPRVDWRMWFLFPNRRMGGEPPEWFQGLARALFRGNDRVLSTLFVSAPPTPPKYLRAMWVCYEFDHQTSGVYWGLRPSGEEGLVRWDKESGIGMVDFLMEHSQLYVEWERAQ